MFDPYHKWLGIPPDQRPLTYYQLLGIAPGEQDLEVIEEAAIRQTAHVRTYQIGPHAAEATRLLNELARARATLLQPARRKAYDARLAQKKAAEVRPAPAPPGAGFREEAGGEGFPIFRDLEPPPPAGEEADGRTRRERMKRPLARAGAGLRSRLGLFLTIALGGLTGSAAGYFLFLQGSGKGPANSPDNLLARKAHAGQSPPAPRAAQPPAPQVPPPRPAPNPGSPADRRPDPRPRPEKAPPAVPPAQNTGNRAVPDPPARKKPASRVAWPQPVPDHAALVQGQERLRQMLARDFPHGKLPDRLVLAARLLARAEKEDDDPGFRFLLYQKAQDSAALGGDLVSSFDAIEAMARRFQIRDVIVRKQKAVTTALNAAKVPAAFRVIADQTLDVVELALAEDDPDTAEALLAQGTTAAQKSNHPAVLAQVSARARDVKEFRHQAERARQAEVTLRKNPEDPAANLELGRFLCLWKGDWDRGLPLLVYGGDPGLREQARKDLAGPKTASALKTLAEGWERLASREKGLPRARLRRRARAWYQKALPDLTGSAKTTVAKKLREIKPGGRAERLPATVPPKPDRQPLSPVVHRAPEEEPAERVLRKAPAPDRAAQARALKEIKELFAKDYERTSPADRRALAGKLLQKAVETGDDPAARFVLYREARALAQEGKDLPTALAAVAALGQEYQGDLLGQQTRTLEAFVQGPALPAAVYRTAAEQALDLAGQAAPAENFEAADRLLACAEVAAQKGHLSSLLKQVAERRQEVADCRKQYEGARAAREALKKDPADPGANLALGKYLCFGKGDWPGGLPLLARGSDAGLGELAKKDLANPEEPAARVGLGDAWKGRGLQEQGPARLQQLRRAYHWYHTALPALTGLTRVRVEKALQALDALPDFQPAGGGEEVRRLEGHTGPVNSVALSRDGRYAFTGGQDGMARFWDVTTGKELRKLGTATADPVKVVALTPDAGKAAFGTAGEALHEDMRKQVGLGRYKFPLQLGSLAYSWNGDRLFIGWSGGQVQVIDLGTGAAPRGGSPTYATGRGRVPHRGPAPVRGDFRNSKWGTVRGVCPSPDGRLVFVLDERGTVHMYDLHHHRDLHRTLLSKSPVVSLACTPDGRYLVTGGADRTIRLWDVATGHQHGLLIGHFGRVTSVAVSADGRRLLSGSEDRTVRLWDLKGRRQLASFARHTGKVTSVALNRDGTVGLSGGADQAVRVWRFPK